MEADIHSSDHSYIESLGEKAQRETNLLEIKRKLETWYTLIPYCVTMRYSREEPAFRNNGILVLWS